MCSPSVPAFHSSCAFTPHGPTAPFHAGLVFTRQMLTRWRPDADSTALDDALLVTAELLANAARHSDGPLALSLGLDPRSGRLRVELTDPSPRLPLLRSARPDEPGGHGLQIIDRLALDWGCRAGSVGKTVWADLLLP